MLLRPWKVNLSCQEIERKFLLLFFSLMPWKFQFSPYGGKERLAFLLWERKIPSKLALTKKCQLWREPDIFWANREFSREKKEKISSGPFANIHISGEKIVHFFSFFIFITWQKEGRKLLRQIIFAWFMPLFFLLLPQPQGCYRKPVVGWIFIQWECTDLLNVHFISAQEQPNFRW